jgi:hypothetical protein
MVMARTYVEERLLQRPKELGTCSSLSLAEERVQRRLPVELIDSVGIPERFRN